jgi:hypothetical protein
VARADEILEAVLRGTSDASIHFDGLRRLLLSLGFRERIKGVTTSTPRTESTKSSTFSPGGDKAKVYQVTQVRHVILKYRLGGEPYAGA